MKRLLPVLFPVVSWVDISYDRKRAFCVVKGSIVNDALPVRAERPHGEFFLKLLAI